MLLDWDHNAEPIVFSPELAQRLIERMPFLENLEISLHGLTGNVGLASLLPHLASLHLYDVFDTPIHVGISTFLSSSVLTSLALVNITGAGLLHWAALLYQITTLTTLHINWRWSWKHWRTYGLLDRSEAIDTLCAYLAQSTLTDVRMSWEHGWSRVLSHLPATLDTLRIDLNTFVVHGRERTELNIAAVRNEQIGRAHV